MIRQPRLKKIFMTLVLVAIGTPALAGLVYQWMPLDGTGGSGRVEFVDGLSFYDGDPADIESFEFTVTYAGASGRQVVFDEFVFENLSDIEVGGEYLCFDNCGKKKAAKKKVTKRKTAKKKTAEKAAATLTFAPVTKKAAGAGDNLSPEQLLALMSWTSDATFGAEKKKKTFIQLETKTTQIVQAGESGYGLWRRVAIPEPSTLMLLLLGLGLLSLARRRITRR